MDKDLAQRSIAETAHDILSGKLSYLDAARKFVNLLRMAGVSEDDSDFVPFVLIDSECDHLPIGRQREFWSAEALERKAPELARGEEWARRTAEEHVRNLLLRFGPIASDGQSC